MLLNRDISRKIRKQWLPPLFYRVPRATGRTSGSGLFGILLYGRFGFHLNRFAGMSLGFTKPATLWRW